MKTIGNGAFQECTSLKSIIIPNSVTKIGDAAFWLCDELETVTIGSSVTSIGELAFEGCSSLKSVTIPNSVKSIGREAFYDCGLTSVTIGNSVKSIGQDAFCEYGNLQKVISRIMTPFAIDEETFYEETYSTAILYVPKGTVDKYKSKKGWRNFKNIKEEDTTTEVDNVTDLINAIGNVEYTAACKAKIDAARSAYDALTKEQQAFVKNFNVLIEAEKAYKQFEKTGIVNVETKAENKVGKYIENGKIMIVKNGKKYNLNGQAE